MSVDTYGVVWQPVVDKHRTWFAEFGDKRALLYHEGSKSTALWILLVTDVPVDSLTYQVWLGAERHYITGSATTEEACRIAWGWITGKEFPAEAAGPTTAELVRQDVQEALEELEGVMAFMNYLTDDYERLSEVRTILGRALERGE